MTYRRAFLDNGVLMTPKQGETAPFISVERCGDKSMVEGIHCDSYDCKELEIYIDNLRKIYGEFHYAPFKTLFDPANELKQLQIFLPRYRPKGGKTKFFSKSSDFCINSPNRSPELVSKTEDRAIEKQPVDRLIKTKAEDTDITMEGYGTDDESLMNSQMYDNNLRRFRNENSDAEVDDDESEDKIESEPEDELDSTCPNPVNFDNSPMRGKVRTRGGLNTSTGKLKVIPRLIAHTEEPPDDIFEDGPSKISRRNSDQSVKSDCSRLSNPSDKINFVDISENVEIALGNNKCDSLNTLEFRSDKPEVSPARPEVSPNKPEVSPNKPEVSPDKPLQNNAGGEVDVKVKPVQVQIQNNEFSLVPQKKFKMTEHLIKRFTQTVNSTNGNSNVSESVTNDHEMMTSSATSKEEELPAQQVSKESGSHAIRNGANPCEAENKLPSINENLSRREDEVINKNPDSSLSDTVSNEAISKDTKQDLINISDYTDKKLASKPISPVNLEMDSAPATDVNTNDLNTTLCKSSNVTYCNSTEEICDTPINSSKTSVENSGNCTEANSDGKQNDNESLNIILDVKHSITDIVKPSQAQLMLHRDLSNQVAVIEHIEDSDESLDDSQIDEANIRNIIHSSLNDNQNVVKPTITEIHENQITDSGDSQKRKLTDEEAIDSVPTKLIKLLTTSSFGHEIPKKISTNEVTPDIHFTKNSNSLVQTVLTNSFKANCTANSDKGELINHPSSKFIKDSINGIEGSDEPMLLDIKSEPESDAEVQGRESEYMEAKRKYMSALNISEKHSLKSRTPEIRTRSKTEEFRFKPLDNLSKTINDVATNINTCHDGSIYPSKKNDKHVIIDEKQIYVKPLCQMQEPHKQRARKSFPKPNYSAPPKSPLVTKPSKNDGLQSVLKKPVALQSASSEKQKPTESIGVTPSNLILLTQPQSSVGSIALLPPNQTITYSLGTPVLAVVSQPTTTTTTAATTILTKPILKPVNVKVLKSQNFNSSQNYIPQNETSESSTPSPSEPPGEGNASTMINRLLANPIVASANQPCESDDYHESSVPATSEEFTILNGILPENICKEVSNLLVRPPPKLKPRPPGPLTTTYEEGAPSSAGPVTAKINSIAHRLSDYFRGMIIELLEDFSKTDNKEATISLLQSEIETLKHAHSVEICEIKKNICITLKDIQKSIIEDREKIIDETRASCEAEAIKRIEEAKSKQWCANCSKEAQFYCCWNTSYCDYPCQQKHWVKHMNKCTQSSNNQHPPPTVNRNAPQYIIKQATTRDARRIVGKPTKVYVNRSLVSKNVSAYKATSGGQLTLLESVPVNYEQQGMGPIVRGKIISTSLVSKIKSANLSSPPSTSSSSSSNPNVAKISSVIQAKSPPSIIPARSITTLSDGSD